MKRTIAAAAAVLLLLLLLTACKPRTNGDPYTAASPGSVSAGDAISVTRVHVDDRVVTCVTWQRGSAGGLSCDWANAKPASR